MKHLLCRLAILVALSASLPFSAHAAAEAKPSRVRTACVWAFNGAALVLFAWQGVASIRGKVSPPAEAGHGAAIRESGTYFKSVKESALLEIEDLERQLVKLRDTPDIVRLTRLRAVCYRRIHFARARIAEADLFLATFEGREDAGSRQRQTFLVRSAQAQLHYIVGVLVRLHGPGGSAESIEEEDELWVERIAAEDLAIEMFHDAQSDLRLGGSSKDATRAFLLGELLPMQYGSGDLPQVYRRLVESLDAPPPRVNARHLQWK